ncbi:MAG: ABC transporter ATP-binding protein [Chloroflexia bacterium]
MNVALPLAEYRDLLGTYLRPQRGRVALLAGLLLGSTVLQLVNPQIIRYFIDTAQAGDPEGTLLLAAAAFLVFGLAQRALDLFTNFVSWNVGWNATNALRTALAGHLLGLDMPFHKTHTPGELIERVDGDVTGLADFFSHLVVRFLGNLLLVVAIVVLLFREDWRAGVGLTVYVAVTLGALASLQNFGSRRWTAYRQARAEQYGFLEERLGGAEDIRAVGGEEYVLRGLYARGRELLRHGRGVFMAESLSSVITNFLFITGYGLGLALGAYLYLQQAVSIGTAFLIVYYIGMLAAPLESIGHQAGRMQDVAASVGRVQELFRLQPHVREAARAALPSGRLRVAFESVSFAYDDGPGVGGRGSGVRGRGSGVGSEVLPTDAGPEPVLREVIFSLPAGRVLGVLGRTGSGKTTLTRLLFRLYDPTRGAICLGGMDIRDVSFEELRRHVGMVTQDVQLFQASIRDNISFFNPSGGDEPIRRALAELGLLDWVYAMPEGLGTRLEAGGGGLSAGEAQLLAFTRVLLKDPGLVILDEAAARLDPITERRLEHAIDRLLEGRTGIVIAHRLRTVQRADDILILEGGEVVEYGPREELAADPDSRFYSLLRTGLEEALA